ncbi:MFS transporter [Chimaeribacter californicus]|uniref:MFS transporter n=1 Tax=Chimaeribacter californicus TaxID=2060067 RepID=A0A2N5DZ49_9GAMM|nr:MFS transporter [Chimaeribacter californicus]PLR33025.1 MFS transporter [Chimaeribacter californicus]
MAQLPRSWQAAAPQAAPRSTPAHHLPTGRLLVLIGIVLVSLNLRAAVTSLSAIYNVIAPDIHGFNAGVLGVLPLLSFALFGSLTALVSRRLGYEGALVLAMLMVCAGIGLRSFSHSFTAFMLYSVLALAGMGFGNVLVQPTIKKYFPDHIGGLTAVYAVMIAVSAGLPSAIAVPITQSDGWRANVALWSLTALLAALPWLWQVFRHRHDHPAAGTAPGTPPAAPHIALWRWPVAWSLVILFGVSMMSMYAMLNWLPTYLVQRGITAATAGDMLFVYNIVGIVHSILIPLWLGRMKKPYLVVAAGGLLQIISYMGFLYLPQAAWLWAVVAAPGLMTIPATFQLINLRTHTVGGAASLSSFTQGIGYVFAAAGPFLFGHLHHGNNWSLSFWFLTAMSVLMLLAGGAAVRRVYLEEAG